MKFIKIKAISKYFFFSIFLLGSISCSDFLDETDPSNLTPDSFYTTPKHAESAIAAVYDRARFIGGGSGIFSSVWQMLEAPTGTTATETAQNSDLNNLYALTFDSNTGHIQNWWTGVYRVVANANLVIANVPDIEMNETSKKQILGEAYFFRAWAHFYAVRIWGDVPLITEPQSATSEDFFASRTPQAAVYAQIVSDLIAAEGAGLSWTDESGRVSQAAAKSLLAKVYLTMAGQPLNDASGYGLAAGKAKEVIDNAGSIGLFSTYGEIHDESLKNTKEHIFSLQYWNEVSSNPMGNMFPNFKPVSYRGPSGTGSTIPNIKFYDSFEAGDLRTVNQQGWFYNTYYQNGDGAPFNLGGQYIFKHFNVTANGTSGVPGTTRDDLNVPIIRYAEVLLIYAEASNEVGGPNQQAVDGLTAIRDRATLATLAVGGYTKDTFRDAVLRERWYELCFEQITWFDMVRLRKVLNHGTKQFDAFVGHVNDNSGQALEDRHLLFPIPFQEFVNNPGLVDQNPGYN
jgi:hypothetical protein